MRQDMLMVQGTTSDAGKSIVVAGLCRLLKRRGICVAPFKPQNMALNSAVTVEGGEIGRAQALQAQACGLAPSIDMNPILLKPSSDTGAQVIVHGKAIADMEAAIFHDYKKAAMQAVLESIDRLTETVEFTVVEGAGSPAEINLRHNDIANMGFAEAVDCPVILVADIDRGGVFAHLVGTLDLLSESERDRVVGFVINKFRGDIALLEPGLEWLEARTGKPVIGVLPYLNGLTLDEEDAINTKQELDDADAALRVAVPIFSRISNHTDFDPLRMHPQVDLRYVGPGESMPATDLIVLPGSKAVRQDLQLLCEYGWDKAIRHHLRYGGKLIGVCGGFQMLGELVSDPDGVEGPAGQSAGLGLLEISTIIRPEKQLRRVRGELLLGPGTVEGYEIHCGETVGRALERPAIRLDDGRLDGALSRDEQVLGTYMHGLFDQPETCSHLLTWAGLRDAQTVDIATLREQSLEMLADAFDIHLDCERLFGARWAT